MAKIDLSISTGQRWSELAVVARYNARELARLRNISMRHLHRQCWQLFKLPPQKWLDRLRLEASRELLLSGQQIKRVSFELGFKRQSHFCRQFKDLYRMTPSEFSARHADRAGGHSEIGNFPEAQAVPV